MFADLQLGDSTGVESTALVRREAVQLLGDRSVVYLADHTQPGRFIEGEVAVGRSTDDNVEVLSGVRAGNEMTATVVLVRCSRPDGHPAYQQFGSVSGGHLNRHSGFG